MNASTASAVMLGTMCGAVQAASLTETMGEGPSLEYTPPESTITVGYRTGAAALAALGAVVIGSSSAVAHASPGEAQQTQDPTLRGCMATVERERGDIHSAHMIGIIEGALGVGLLCTVIRYRRPIWRATKRTIGLFNPFGIGPKLDARLKKSIKSAPSGPEDPK